jgi:superfamily II DNA/RNA helicase
MHTVQVGVDACLYHKKLPPATRADALTQMHGSDACVLVCTDAAARGLDFKDVGHVIQADFADNAVDFLHRIGRTARADRCAPVSTAIAAGGDCALPALMQCKHAGICGSRGVQGGACHKVVHSCRVGRVTSFYTKEREALALAIKGAIEAGEPVEGTFSRNRSFSSKMKKHGKYVPRGAVA